MFSESNSYRKGLTLGLTLAEIFILLLFLLLLILLGYYAVADKRKAELVETRKALVVEQEKVEAINDLPEEIQDLVRTNLKLQDELETTRREKGMRQNLVAEKEQELRAQEQC